MEVFRIKPIRWIEETNGRHTAALGRAVFHVAKDPNESWGWAILVHGELFDHSTFYPDPASARAAVEKYWREFIGGALETIGTGRIVARSIGPVPFPNAFGGLPFVHVLRVEATAAEVEAEYPSPQPPAPIDSKPATWCGSNLEDLH